MYKWSLMNKKLLGVKVFLGNLVPGFTTIQKCASDCNGIVVLHTAGKMLEKKISFTWISRNRRSAMSQLREKLCTLSILKAQAFWRPQGQTCGLQTAVHIWQTWEPRPWMCQVGPSTSVDHSSIPGHIFTSRADQGISGVAPSCRLPSVRRWPGPGLLLLLL